MSRLNSGIAGVKLAPEIFTSTLLQFDLSQPVGKYVIKILAFVNVASEGKAFIFPLMTSAPLWSQTTASLAPMRVISPIEFQT